MQKLFEMLILEGAQAGLSWITILKRRENYRKAYDGFDPSVMAAWNDSKIISLCSNQEIIRNRLKIISARGNARAYMKILESSQTLLQVLKRETVNLVKKKQSSH